MDVLITVATVINLILQLCYVKSVPITCFRMELICVNYVMRIVNQMIVKIIVRNAILVHIPLKMNHIADHAK